MPLVTQIQKYFTDREFIVHSISIRAGRVVARVDDDKLVGVLTPGAKSLELSGDFNVFQIPLEIQAGEHTSFSSDRVG